MADLILRDIDPDALRRDIVDEVVTAMRELMTEHAEPRTVDRQRMAELLGISLPTLDREATEGRIPSIKIGTRRVFEPRKVIDALSALEQTRTNE